MCSVVIFGGTTEGRLLAEFFDRQQIPTYVCVATAYGSSLLPEGDWLTVSDKRLSREEMEALFQRLKPEVVVDATHPYAADVTENVREAAAACGVTCLRLKRNTEEGCICDAAVTVDSVAEAVEYLKHTEGRILAATGSKELTAYTELPGYRDRVVARVLSTGDVAAQCGALGFEGKNLICMQGPFSKELNQAILQQYQCKYMVTKISGAAGGYEEKIEAALACGCTPVLVGRPAEEMQGALTYFQCRQKVCEILGCRTRRRISLVGIGMGSSLSMTFEAKKAMEEAELIIGAKRMTEAAARPGQAVCSEYESGAIAAYIEAHPQYEKIAVALSGDIGFFSGAKKLAEKLNSPLYSLSFVPGISSLSYFTGKIGKSYEDAAVISNHGKEIPLIPVIRDRARVFSILGKPDSVRSIAGRLVLSGLDSVNIHVGERLSYPDEKIFSGKPADFLHYENDPLAVIFIENEDVERTRLNPLTVRADSEFIRDKVPMTKEEIRCLSVSKLRLSRNAVCYDVGAGTGSIAVEMAVRAVFGKVWAIEKKPEAAALLLKNKQKFMADNMEIVEGDAPEALQDLPAPTHVFIGGSSGNMREILQTVFEKNSAARVVINCIAMETAAEALSCAREFSCGDEEVVQIQASRGRSLAGYTMMTAENPITIISFTGRGGTL